MTQARRTVMLQNGMRLRGFDPMGQIREVVTEPGDAQPGLLVNQLGTGRIVDFQDAGVSRLHVLDGGAVVVGVSMAVGPNAAASGIYRAQNNPVGGVLAARNAANTGDIPLITLTAGNIVHVDPVGWSVQLGSAGGAVGFYQTVPVQRGAAVADVPAGGVGTAAGGWDTAANRDAAINSINALLARLRAATGVGLFA